MTTIRRYKEKDVKRLISAAGGRCSYRHDGEICKCLLVVNQSVIGEKAHIVAVSKKGPRYDRFFNFEYANSYDNLLWLCPTHHTVIDKMADVDIYTVDVLNKMKKDHERDIKNGNYSTGITLYDAVIHDYSALSTLFTYVDINKLYSSTLDLPSKFDIEFLSLSNMVEAYEDGNGTFYLKDVYLDKLFNIMLKQAYHLYRVLKKYFYIDYIMKDEAITQCTCHCFSHTTNEDVKWVLKYLCRYQEAVDNFISAMERRYPEIFYQPLYSID